jgi:hypothetical protein
MPLCRIFLLAQRSGPAALICRPCCLNLQAPKSLVVCAYPTISFTLPSPRRGNVEVAVAPGKGERRGAVQQSVTAFAADALLGKGRVKRAPAISLSSLQPSVGRSGTRFTAAKNFATAKPLDPSARPLGPSKASRRRKRRAQPVQVSAAPTALDRRAAKLMRGLA